MRTRKRVGNKYPLKVSTEPNPNLKYCHNGLGRGNQASKHLFYVYFAIIILVRLVVCPNKLRVNKQVPP